MSDRGTWRAIFCKLLDDVHFQRLSPHARLTLLVARQCAQAGPAACFRYYPATLAAQTGLTPEQLEAALVELEQPAPREPWIYRDRDELVLWVRNALRYDPTHIAGHERHMKGVERAVGSLPAQSPIVARFRKYYRLDETQLTLSKGSREGSETLQICKTQKQNQKQIQTQTQRVPEPFREPQETLSSSSVFPSNSHGHNGTSPGRISEAWRDQQAGVVKW